MKAKTKTNYVDFNIDDNKTEYTLGNGRKIAFDAGDIALPGRIFDAYDKIGEYMEAEKKRLGINKPEDVKKLKVDDLGALLEKYAEQDRFVRDVMNRAFNTCEPDEAGWQDVAAAAFGTANCVSVSKITGNCYYEDFFDVFFPIIEAEYGVRAEKVSKRVEKYTQNKGKHTVK